MAEYTLAEMSVPSDKITLLNISVPKYKCSKCSLIFEWFPYNSFSGSPICPQCFDDFIKDNVPVGVKI